MDLNIRVARPEDEAAIAEFTTDTFEWGDYVADVFAHWLTTEDGQVMVAVDDHDRPVAIGRGEMLSPTELWLQGARVSETWRRRGVASAIGQALIDWARGRGALVARLLTESWNEPAQRQVEKSGFRRGGDWVSASRAVSPPSPSATGNGGQRAKARRKLELAHSSEAIPAFVSWRSGPLLAPSRGLHASGWRWSQLTAEHLIAAGKEGRLWSSRAGWIVSRTDSDTFYAEWLDCGPDDITDMIRSIVDLAIESHAERMRIMVPEVDWVTDELQRTSFDLHPMHIYEKPL